MMKKYLFFLLALLPLAVSAVDMKRVSVHDPSVVWEPTTKTYYIFGSHRAAAKTKDLMNWTSFQAPWDNGYNKNCSNSAAFETPVVKKVKKGGEEVDFPAFNARKWAARGSNSYNIDGNMWAPDVIWNKAMQKWCMYLSINGDNWYSSIILLTADNIEGPYRYQGPVVISGFHTGNAYKDTDLELVLGPLDKLPSRYNAPWASTSKVSLPNNIDPCVFYDEKGNLWIAYGSWSGGIFMLELDEETGLRDYDITYSTTGGDPYFGKRIAGGFYVSGEAPYIEYIDGYYYLFVTYGGLAAGGVKNDYNNGGYQMRVFRSENPDGPYVDARNTSAVFKSFMTDFGPSANDNRGVNIFGAYGEWGNMAKGSYGERSQGHNSIIAAEDGRTYLVYHTRFQNRGEEHQVRVHQVFQNEDGWLVAAPFEYTGEQVTSADIAITQQIATDRIPGTWQVLIHPFKLDHTKKEIAKPVEVQLNADGSVSGAQTGTWSVQEGTSYFTIKLGTTEYKGVMVEQTLEPSDDKAASFTVMNRNGVTVWGYQTSPATGIQYVMVNDPCSIFDDAWYDLRGHRITTPTKKGIYIHNGKKVIR
jgi:arabinan endo-1,5-alpha-L-arabinosidase